MSAQSTHPRAPQLGELERTVMDALWDHADGSTDTEPVSVREALALLPAEREPAYTTVMTVMDRLTKKGLLTRERDGKAWRYRPVGTRASLTGDVLRSTLEQVDDRQAALMHFLDAASADELDDLRAALAEVERRRG